MRGTVGPDGTTHREILLNQTDIRLYLPFSDWFESKRTSVWIQMNRKMVNTIWFRVDLIRFRKDFSVCSHWRIHDLSPSWRYCTRIARGFLAKIPLKRCQFIRIPITSLNASLQNVCFFVLPDCNYFHRRSERLTPLGIMGEQLTAFLEVQYCHDVWDVVRELLTH